MGTEEQECVGPGPDDHPVVEFKRVAAGYNPMPFSYWAKQGGQEKEQLCLVRQQLRGLHAGQADASALSSALRSYTCLLWKWPNQQPLLQQHPEVGWPSAVLPVIGVQHWCQVAGGVLEESPTHCTQSATLPFFVTQSTPTWTSFFSEPPIDCVIVMTDSCPCPCLQVESGHVVVQRLDLHFGTTWLVYYRYRQQQVEQLLGSTWDEASLVGRLPQLAAGFESVAALTPSGQLVVGDRWRNGLRVVPHSSPLWSEELGTLADWVDVSRRAGDLLVGEHDSIRVIQEQLQASMVLLLPIGPLFAEDDISKVRGPTLGQQDAGCSAFMILAPLRLLLVGPYQAQVGTLKATSTPPYPHVSCLLVLQLTAYA